jgi:hypothetical protein
MPKTVEAIFIQEITVVDPDSKGAVEVEIWKDPVTGGIFGIDASFLDHTDRKFVVSPFDKKVVLRLPEPK